MKYVARIHNKEFSIELEDRGGEVVAIFEEGTYPIQLNEIDGSRIFSALIGNRSFEIEINRNSTGYLVSHQGRSLKCTVEDERLVRLKRAMGSQVVDRQEKELRAPMPGLVVVVEATPGQRVKPGDGLLIIEAMKMENEIRAKFEGTVKEIKIQPRQPVEKNQVLMIFE
ncbi:MAG: biotin/lipoyl-containing protein [Candidatus Zhuqueibacterota bacterium]